MHKIRPQMSDETESRRNVSGQVKDNGIKVLILCIFEVSEHLLGSLGTTYLQGQSHLARTLKVNSICDKWPTYAAGSTLDGFMWSTHF
jgi:hypothetical protein